MLWSSRPCGAVLVAACVLGTSLTGAEEPPSLGEIKARLTQQRREIKDFCVRTKREFKSPFSAEELYERWDLWGGVPSLHSREEFSAFKGQKRYYRYNELGEDLSPPPRAPELAADATPLLQV